MASSPRSPRGRRYRRRCCGAGCCWCCSRWDEHGHQAGRGHRQARRERGRPAPGTAPVRQPDQPACGAGAAGQRHLAARDAACWGEGTACASDSKKFGSWSSNFMTEWHQRYCGPGVMIYWHVEKKSLCVYSQLKSCSASEVAAMIEGVLRHCTDVEIDRQYTDTHGASIVGLAFAHMLGFNLLPRLKNVGSARLYRLAAGQDEKWPHLAPVLSTKLSTGT
ncbi:Tn3 family transposase [Streptomyces avermitilis]|uniref:Tn3 family transposase n=1 Tax=Streptomyces avermitilis TaxID=33903 RepID=UPI0038082D25